MEDYQSEFEAPAYTILSEERIGTKVVKTVIFEDEVQVFEVERGVYAAGQDLVSKKKETSDEQ